jgi:hypothetical protein
MLGFMVIHLRHWKATRHCAKLAYLVCRSRHSHSRGVAAAAF